jgi:hypothetical protein
VLPFCLAVVLLFSDGKKNVVLDLRHEVHRSGSYSLRYHFSSSLGPDVAYKKSLIKGNFSMIILNK